MDMGTVALACLAVLPAWAGRAWVPERGKGFIFGYAFAIVPIAKAIPQEVF
jgi:hypothetical protein